MYANYSYSVSCYRNWNRGWKILIVCEIIFLKMSHPRNCSGALEYTALIYSAYIPIQRRESEGLVHKAVKTLKMNNHVISEESEKSVNIF